MQRIKKKKSKKISRVGNDIGNIEPNYCNYPDPLKEDDDYF